MAAGRRCGMSAVLRFTGRTLIKLFVTVCVLMIGLVVLGMVALVFFAAI
jgi:hypothetical protein